MQGQGDAAQIQNLLLAQQQQQQQQSAASMQNQIMQAQQLLQLNQLLQSAQQDVSGESLPLPWNPHPIYSLPLLFLDKIVSRTACGK